MIFSKIPAKNESELQCAVCQYLESLEAQGLLTFNHAPLGMKSSWKQGKKMKASGAKKGHPDFDIFLDGGKMRFVELKTLKGYANPSQKARHRLLRGLGYEVEVIYAEAPYDAVMAVKEALGL